MRKLLSGLVVFITFITSSPFLFATSPQPTSVFISVADIHFDPFAGCSITQAPCQLLTKLEETPYKDWEAVFNQYGENHDSRTYADANYPLFKASLVKLKQVNTDVHPLFVLMLGDFIAHEFREKYAAYARHNNNASYIAFVKKTLQFMTYEFQKTFPNVDVYSVVGNNDSYTGDYSVIPNGLFLKDASKTWGTLIKDPQNLEGFRSTFSKAGYYEVTIPHYPQDKIIVLNTVLFSENSKRNAAKQAALEQLKWLHERLVAAKAAHQHVLIVFHIPIGIDVLATIQSKFSIKEFWKPIYTKMFKSELKEFSDVITGILPGHIHIDIFHKIVLKQLADIPVSFTPSISPIFGNSPSFRVFTFDTDSLVLTSFKTYIYALNADTPEWSKK